jgi:predicted ATPase/class 3 adenylate cyclase
VAELPSGTVTFLFTDLERSTRLWEQHPEPMQEALARHDDVLRRAVEEHGGHVVKTTGDGLHAAFATAHDAVGAAVDAQRNLDGEAWPLPDPLRVRMGLHTGEAEIRDGDYYGTAVNRAARIAGVAHGGQILCSFATEELVHDHLPDGVTLKDLGEHALRDLARPEHLLQIGATGLSGEFPPLRSLDATPNNLPRQLASFVGREREFTRVTEALTTSPIVTLTGVGGVGKTRLAMQVAGEVMPHYPDGAWLVELAPLHDPDAIVAVVASELRLQLPPGVSPLDGLLDMLQRRRLLMVLDNCEHLISATAALGTAIAQRCDGVRILATSREALAVDGEVTVPIGGLLGQDGSRDDAAIALFVDRARAVRPDFVLTDANRDAVTQISLRLDGVPLAIELAAARVKALTPAAIADRLDERFQLLAGGRRGAVERHQTLRAAIDWSYELLDDAERSTLDQLAVFAGSFDLDAVEAIVSLDGTRTHLDLIETLTDKSLVVAEEVGDTMRYRLLETIRQYALEQLDTTGGTRDVRDRHLEYCTVLVEDTSDAFFSAEESEALAWLEREADNLRAAIMWAVDTAQIDLGLRMLVALGLVGGIGRSNPLARWYDAVLELDGASAHELAPLCTAYAGLLTMHAGASDRTVLLSRSANELAREHATDHWALHITAAAAAMYAGQFQDGLDAIARGLALATDEVAVCLLRVLEAAIRSFAFGLSTGRDAAEAGHAAAERSGSPTLIAFALVSEAYANRDDDPGTAKELFTSVLHVVGPTARNMATEMAHANLAEFLARDGDLAGCRSHAAAAITSGVQRAGWQGFSQTLTFLAMALVALGRAEDAAEALGASLAIAPAIEFSPDFGSATARLGGVLPAERIDTGRRRGAARTRDEIITWITDVIDDATRAASDA